MDWQLHGTQSRTPFAFDNVAATEVITPTKTNTTMEMTLRFTKDAIDAARATYEQLLGERRDRARDDNDDGDDGEDEVAIDEVVVARDVTLADLDEVPNDWLDGVQLALLANGTLVVDRLVSEEYSRARGEATRAVGNYAVTNQALDLGSSTTKKIDCGALGWRTPSVVLDQRVLHRAVGIPLVFADVFIEDDSLHDDIFERVATYFRNNHTVVRVVVFKFLSPRRPASTNGRYEVPALAMAFALSDQQNRASRIRVIETESFGNAPLSEVVVNSVALAARSDDFEWLDRATVARLQQPPIQSVIMSANPQPGLATFRQRNESEPCATFEVSMPPPLGPMTFDLVELFRAAITGRGEDDATRRAAQVADGAAAPALAAPAPGP